MVESIQLGMERMISELEDYKTRGIFSPHELRKIVETRKKYELRLQRPEKKLLDFMRYIKSECILEKIRDKRVKKKNVGFSLHDMNISKKIVELYRSALYRFNDPRIVSQFTAYVMGKKMYGEMKNVFAECCTRNPLDVDLWIYCAFKLFEVGDIESARAMFLKGIRMNSKSTRIRIEFFRMEVMYIEKIEIQNKEIGLDSDDKDEIERGEVAFAIFVDCFNSPSFTGKEVNEVLKISESVKELKEKIGEYARSKGL
ncbi:snoRNA-binding rRNA-processing protein UTP6 [Encephalitozoon intestinalis ATCC 50506]|uniref:U3 small nucleolar RNA-associated protein 6 N-terminal domain-containing protein n=1 Tax=Encephalitozoon intestinalis (strain ATCC 50506) TaxID=876142 RepID=E0S7T1_ENCIT|nr:snoRNA-binding rRNA-processing protein UTP6 [Encephalitozoon intestinalis ATCC 50506]ADM11766.1 hypothetical protein Eint_070010 [Encephalitozoon intestinalis ATCC 50506]UTX45514.1 U3 small nucleolar RNA-associated protein 6 [Encephalitozoon intestinalis]